MARASWKYGEPIECDGPRVIGTEPQCRNLATIGESIEWEVNGMKGVSACYWCDDHKPPVRDNSTTYALGSAPTEDSQR